jgi:hypothetical protein
VTTPDATLPSNNFLKPDMPLVPTTIKSIFLSSAYSTIAATTDFSVAMIFVEILIASDLSNLPLILSNHLLASCSIFSLSFGGTTPNIPEACPNFTSGSMTCI